MPHCRKCNQDHFNFKACPPPAKPVHILARHPAERSLSDGYRGIRGWGQSWGNAPRGPEILFAHPMRIRNGSISAPDGGEYEPPPLEAA